MRIVVATASFGEKRGCLYTPHNVSPEAEYYAFCDRKITARSPWRRQIVQCSGSGLMAAKRIKLFPWELVPGADWYIWIDSQCRLVASPESLVHRTGDHEIGLIEKRQRCIYAETRLCIKKRKADETALQACSDAYRIDGHPEHGGLFYGGCLVLRRCDRTAEFSRLLWSQIERWHARDQVHIPYVLRKLEIVPHVFPSVRSVFREGS